MEKNIKILGDISSINLNIENYLLWDDIRYYDQILDLLNSSNENLRLLASLILPNIESFMNMTYNMLDYKNNKSNLSDFEKKFLSKLHQIVKSTNPLYNNFKYTSQPDKFAFHTKLSNNENESNSSKNTTSSTSPLDNYIICTSNPEIIAQSKLLPDELRSKITYNTQKVVGYNPKKPIFIKNEDGSICTIDKVPGRKFSVNMKPEYLEVAYIFLPDLKNTNLDEASFPGFRKPSIEFSRNENADVEINQSPFSVIPGESTFSILEQFNKRFSYSR